jgi:hypothetical protein
MSDFFKNLFGKGPAKPPQGIRGLPVADLLARLPFEAQVVPRKGAGEAVLKAHRERPETHAFLITEPKDLGLFVEFLENAEQSPEQILSTATSLTFDAWVSAWQAEQRKLEETYGKEPEDDRHGEWPEDAEPFGGGEPQIPGSLFQGRDVVIGYSPAPVARWWETFAHTRFGNWNDCPAPEVHVMLGKRWAEHHGAILTVHGYDFVEFSIEKPVASRKEAMAMAELHQMYCSDTLNDSTYEEYAAGLIGARTWGFWWD